MAGDRSGDIVLAGSGGQQASMTLSTLFDQTHRSTSLVLAIDSLIIVLIAWDIASVSQQYLGRLSMLIWAIPLFATTSTWFSYRSRRTWAYWPGAIILALASLLFFLLFILNLYYVILGSVGSILFLLIMGYASYSSFNRMRYHFSPLYKQGYHTFVPTPEANLMDGEMLAACPSCMAVLAIRPDLLSPADTCPHCNSPLVSRDLATRHGWEEE
ncbi:MAG: hypothetical protein CBC77_002820 [Euryarchaeota archaeon TMED117]|nr:MAG: hypothetical protein CBC77_002820 [Euryarchaeota archaeon TMED117]|tara:strand:- start:2510 stop:3151 length:642 start_codon:yes stop_codon:yes gene_type:complete